MELVGELKTELGQSFASEISPAHGKRESKDLYELCKVHSVSYTKGATHKPLSLGMGNRATLQASGALS